MAGCGDAERARELVAGARAGGVGVACGAIGGGRMGRGDRGGGIFRAAAVEDRVARADGSAGGGGVAGAGGVRRGGIGSVVGGGGKR